MNSQDPESAAHLLAQLPPESIKTLAEVEKMIAYFPMKIG
jgi:hypothetical protein